MTAGMKWDANGPRVRAHEEVSGAVAPRVIAPHIPRRRTATCRHTAS